MKKLSALVISGMLMLPMMANSAGFIGVGTTYLYGTMSHTYSTTNAAIQAYGYAGSTIYFYAYVYNTATAAYDTFYCTVQPTAANYAAAVETKAHFNVGTYIYVYGTNGGTCTGTYYNKSSAYVS